MGTSFSVQTAISQIVNKTVLEIDQNTNVSATTNCTISMKNFSFTNSTNCVAKISNYCTADAQANMDSIITAASKVYNDLSVEQKQGVPGLLQSTFGISTNVNNVVNDFSTHIRQKCSAQAITNNNLVFDNITIDNCKSTDGVITFDFLNTGTATGQCVMKALTDVAVTAASQIETKQESGIDINALIWPIVIIVCILSIIYIIINVVSKKIRNVDDEERLLKLANNTYASRISILKDMKNN